jgi:putative transposase
MNRNEPILENEYYHVYNRGNRKQPIFGDDGDYRSFLQKLRDGSSKYLVRIPVYCLMPNHFHLVLVQTDGGSIGRFMNSVETSAANRYNLRYSEVGHLFQGRYKYKRIDSEESLLTVARYVHLNPVAAKLAGRPEDWPYSNFAEYVSAAEGGLVEGVLQSGLTEAEGRLLPGPYVAFVRSAQAETTNMDEGILQL